MAHALRLALIRLVQDRRGQDLIEYAMLAGFVTLAASAAVPGLGPPIQALFDKVTDVFATVGS
ncbi:MAG: Flp family type IVb pilin [Acidobacteria bacterium]|nr:Flp family type IVb pilin [Acidobacteriota bacterium]